MAKVRPYLFYDTATSICTQCLRRVEAKILIKDDQVFMEKWCMQHGTERILIEELSKARPGYGFLGEEGGAVVGADKSHRFIIDPIDGTTNFMHGIPHFAISIGLEREGQLVANGLAVPSALAGVRDLADLMVGHRVESIEIAQGIVPGELLALGRLLAEPFDAEGIAQRFRAYTGETVKVQLGELTAPVIEGAYARFLTALETHLTTHRFLCALCQEIYKPKWKTDDRVVDALPHHGVFRCAGCPRQVRWMHGQAVYTWS